MSFVRLRGCDDPVAACKDGAKALMDKIDKTWPERSKPDKDAFDKIRTRLSVHKVCGDGHVGPLVWRQCEGSVEGKRGYTCGLWLLFHSLAARSVVPSSQKNDYAGATWLATVSRWVEHFFPCEGLSNSRFTSSRWSTRRTASGLWRPCDGVLWSWRAHNEVNKRLAEQERRGEAVGSGDPKFPQDPVAHPRAVPGLSKEDGEWDEDATAKFLVTYFHALGGAPAEARVRR